ncbi:MAG TPA: hypothetical protein VEU33_31265 [Archangium sp.]|nr:hypothetical protein [Archangium sp.]
MRRAFLVSWLFAVSAFAAEPEAPPPPASEGSSPATPKPSKQGVPLLLALSSFWSASLAAQLAVTLSQEGMILAAPAEP